MIHEKRTGRTIVITVYLYWLVLLLWQNFGNYQSSATIVGKVVLLVLLIIVFLMNNVKIFATHFFVWSLFAIFMMFNFLLIDIKITGASLVYYVFPVVFSFLTLVCQNKAAICKKDYLIFLKLFIATVVCMAMYSVFFQTSYFVNLFGLKEAYGNELTSFLISSHEYGMYLVFAITAILICYQNTHRLLHKIIYLAMLGLFVLNLLATFSRTSMLACAVIIIVFTFVSSNNKIKKWMILTMIVFGVACILLPPIRTFVYNVLLKGSDDAGRFDMWNVAIEQIKDAPIVTKLFGQGYLRTETYFQSNFQHNTVHNMFLQNFLIGGLIGTIFEICVIIGAIKNAIACLGYNRNQAVVFIALAFSVIAFMTTNTASIMQSPVDSYMLTVFAIIIPKYVCNSICRNEYEIAKGSSED